LSAGQLCDLARGLLLALCWAGLAYINMSRMYHYIRGQSVLKLYVIFNITQISDKLFCSFGEDILESLFASIVTLAAPRTAAAAGKGGRSPSKGVQILHVVFHFVISALYVFFHAVLLFAQVITLNVSMNSDNSSLFVVLVSNNFIELKGSVFKRFDHHNLMQISAADIVERFQLTVFLAVILIQNLSHLGLVAGARGGEWLERAAWMSFMVLGGEWGIDWVKHGFITKFNGIPPVVYRHFGKVLCTDFIHTHRHKTESSIHSVSRRLGLPSLPIAVLVVRVVYQSFVHSPTPIGMKVALLLVGFGVLLLLKALLTVGLLGHAAKRVVQEPMERERAEAFAAALAAPAHQHLRGKGPAPSPKGVILPRSPRTHAAAAAALQTALSSGGGGATVTGPALVVPHPVQVLAAPFASSKSSLLVPVALHQPSSTSCSPSLFGLREPLRAGGAIGATAPAPSVAADEVVSRSTSPQSRPAQFSTEAGKSELLDAFALPPPAVSAPDRITGGSSSVGADDDRSTASASVATQPAADEEDAESLDTVSSLEVLSAEERRAGLSVNIDAARASTDLEQSSGSLTARFGHLRTPTALERCNSNMSPQPPVTPTLGEQSAEDTPTQHTTTTTTVIHTVHVQVDGSGQVHVAPSSSTAATVASPLMRPLPADGAGAAAGDPASSTTHRVVSVGSSDSSSAGGVPASVVLPEGVAGLDVHIFHHQVVQQPQPQQTPTDQQQPQQQQSAGHPTVIITSPESANIEEVTPGTGTAAAAAAAAAAASGAAFPLPPTVVTINSTTSSSSSGGVAGGGDNAGGSSASAAAPKKDKGQPQYDDEAKISNDLLTVQRYKISAGKAIPV